MRQFVDLLDRIERLDFLGSKVSIEDEHHNKLKGIPVDEAWVPKDSEQETRAVELLSSYVNDICDTLFSDGKPNILKRMGHKYVVFSFTFNGVCYFVGWDRMSWQSACHCIHVEEGSMVRFDSLRDLVSFICITQNRADLEFLLQVSWNANIAKEDEFNHGNDLEKPGPLKVDEIDDEQLFNILKDIPVDREWLPRNRAEEDSSVGKLRGYLQNVCDFLFYGQEVQACLNDRVLDKYFLVVSQGIGYYIGWYRSGFTLKCYMTDFDEKETEIITLSSLRELISILCTVRNKADLGARLSKHWEETAVQFVTRDKYN